MKMPSGYVASLDFRVEVDVLTVSEFCSLCRAVDWDAPPPEQVETALTNSIARFSLYSGGDLIGMGRFVGDRAMFCSVYDFAIRPEFQNRGAGTFLMRFMLDWLRNHLPSGRHICCDLMSATGKTGFYERFGFAPLPNPAMNLENGMTMMVEGKA